VILVEKSISQTSQQHMIITWAIFEKHKSTSIFLSTWESNKTKLKRSKTLLKHKSSKAIQYLKVSMLE